MKRANSTIVCNNFGSHLADSLVYSIVLNRLDPNKCPLINDESLLARAAKAINYARDIGAEVFLAPKVCSYIKHTYIYICIYMYIYS